MERSYGVGIIGLGAMGREMLQEMHAHARFRVVGAWDPSADARALALANSPELPMRDGAQAVMDASGCDVVYVASPPTTHAGHARGAIDRGRALLCEKPLGVELTSSRELVERVQQTATANAVNFNHATAYDAYRAQELLHAGALGAVHYISMRLHLPAWPRPFQAEAAWLAGRAQGGFTREMLPHWVYLSQRLLGPGEVRAAHPVYAEDPTLCERGLMAELEFGGVPAQVSARVGGAGPIGMEYTLWCERSSCRFTSGGGLGRWDGHGWVADAPQPGAPGDRQRGLDSFAALLDGAPHTCASVADALAVQRVIEGMLAA